MRGSEAASKRTFRALRRGSLAAAVAAVAALAAAPACFGRVLRVGTYKGVAGLYKTIQAAVDAAKRGDWILVGAGDYHERGDRVHKPKGEVPPSGVLIRTPNLHLRGMKRNKVIVDGTKPGSPPCSRKKADQDFGLKAKHGRLGRNGIVVWKASKVSIQNLTTCNFLTGNADASGNEIWWNGGDGSGKIGMGAFRGTYLNATSTFYNGIHTAALYGIFSSNSQGPGLWAHDYGSNFADANFYFGACRRVCNQVMNHDWAQYGALGYSGTNSGGKLIVKNSEFDRNKGGFDTNSQNNDDWPSPQDGRCPHGGTSPITHTISCWVFMHNYVHDNNDPNVPSVSIEHGQSPVGTGVSILGGRFDTVMDNRIVDNGAWGLLLAPWPDDEKPPPGQHCQGGTSDTITAQFGFTCTFDDWGNQIFDNTFRNNGFFGNPSNGDIAELTLIDGKPINCYRGNTTPNGTSPAAVQQTNTNCGQIGVANNNLLVLTEAVCNTGLEPSFCLPTDRYPRRTNVVMHALPTKKLDSMPNPCKGVPANPWCRPRKH
jgi:hypothetical protein